MTRLKASGVQIDFFFVQQAGLFKGPFRARVSPSERQCKPQWAFKTWQSLFLHKKGAPVSSNEPLG